MKKLTESQENLIRFLENLVKGQNTGRLAGLRRGVNKPPGIVPEAYSQVVPFFDENSSRRQEAVLYHTAALFALWHQGRDRLPGNPHKDMGKSLQYYKVLTNSESVENRFLALLKSRPETLPHHLRHCVGLLKTKDVPIAWRRLLRDLLLWSHPDRFVQRAWSRSFWGASNEAQTERIQDE